MISSKAILLYIFLFIAIQIHAQNFDYIDVEPGFETLNLAIEGDTTNTGEPVSLTRAYRLQRGQAYLINGSLINISGSPLRIVAAEGDGPLPMIISVVDESGSAANIFNTEGDLYIENLYISGIDNLGNAADKNMIKAGEEGTRVIIQGCYLDHDAQSLIRLNADSIKLYIFDSILRNSVLLANVKNGRFIDTRGNFTDSIVVRNSTLYSASHFPLRTDNGIIKYIEFDHITMNQTGNFYLDGLESSNKSILQIEHAVEAKITNNIFFDVGYEGLNIAARDTLQNVDTLKYPIVGIDSLNAPDIALERERSFTIKNNLYGYSQAIESFFAQHNDIEKPVFLNSYGQSFVDNFGYDVSNNIQGTIDFVDAPGTDKILEYAEYRYNSNYSDENNPDPRADRNGLGELANNPETFGPGADDYNFDYSVTSPAYTMAEGGFPAGDLNWFPDKKSEWENITDIENNNNNVVVNHYSLEQNYPNPFNPTTNIEYSLPGKTNVTLTIYNMLGQKEIELISGVQLAGKYNVNWNGKDNKGNKLATGIYIYNLKAGEVNISRKMILMK